MNWESITICGGGNGAHALLALLLKHSNSRLTLYVPIEQEFQSFQAVKDGKTPFTLIVKDGTGVVEFGIPYGHKFLDK